jgi:tetratricopeptide (TPR) repeat protein
MGVSLCIIARDEAHNLEQCIRPVRHLMDEVIVADTGSTDTTRLLAESLGARVFDVPWKDDFAAARNACVDLATSDWIFWLDADDRVDEENAVALGRLFSALGDENAAYLMACRSIMDSGIRAEELAHVRLFRNAPALRWAGRVHEQIMPALVRQRVPVRKAEVVITHHGYQDGALLARKRERNRHLLDLECAERPDDAEPFLLRGSLLFDLGQPKLALSDLEIVRSRTLDHAQLPRRFHVLVAQCHRDLESLPLALGAVRGGRALYPDDADLLFLEAQILLERGDPVAAEKALVHLLNENDSATGMHRDLAVTGYLARFLLAVAALMQGAHEKAEQEARAVVSAQPAFSQGWLVLLEALASQDKIAELDAVIEKVEQLAPSDPSFLIFKDEHQRRRKPSTSARIDVGADALQHARDT